LGGLVGSIAATAMRGPGLEGVLLCVAGAALGVFAGFMFRRELVVIGCAYGPVAVAEDIVAVICAIYTIHIVTKPGSGATALHAARKPGNLPEGFDSSIRLPHRFTLPSGGSDGSLARPIRSEAISLT
jgi:hypothetical protein